MPLHDYTKRIYEDVADPQYIVRFLDYLISKRYKRVVFAVNGYTVVPLITGVLEDPKSKKRYYSIADFYNSVTGSNMRQTDISILSKIFVTQDYSVMRIICNYGEVEVLGFIDKKYRSFLMYRDILKRIEYYVMIRVDGAIKLHWADNDFEIGSVYVTCKEDPKLENDLLAAHEGGFIEGLYYHSESGLKLISDK